MAQVSKTVMPVLVPTRQVFSHKVVVFSSGDPGTLAVLSSAVHYWWAISRSATMKADLSYSPSDVIATLPLPPVTQELRSLGARLDAERRDILFTRNAGLTDTYNLVHSPANDDADIVNLREIHRLIDESVLRAYGWEDLLAVGLGHGHHQTRQGTRYTIAPSVRQEVLDRLLKENHERYAAEKAAGLHDKGARKKAKKQVAKPAPQEEELFDAE